jgi:hypothetical protein
MKKLSETVRWQLPSSIEICEIGVALEAMPMMTWSDTGKYMDSIWIRI